MAQPKTLAENRNPPLPPMSYIDRRKCERVVPMKVLVLGFCRTGTRSVRTALRELGYEDTYHMVSAYFENTLDCEMWNDAIAAKWDGKGEFTKADWDKLLGHCMAVTDMPCAAFAPELIAAYPDAKVILTNRDVDSWHHSTLVTAHTQIVSKLMWFLTFFNADIRRTNTMVNLLWDRLNDGDFPKNGKKVFTEHYAEVRRIMADRPQDLLEYQVKQGWGPLCKFLDKPVPHQEFPRTNDIESFNAWTAAMRMAQIKYLVKILVPTLASFGVVCGGIIWAMKIGQ